MSTENTESQRWHHKTFGGTSEGLDVALYAAFMCHTDCSLFQRCACSLVIRGTSMFNIEINWRKRVREFFPSFKQDAFIHNLKTWTRFWACAIHTHSLASHEKAMYCTEGPLILMCPSHTVSRSMLWTKLARSLFYEINTCPVPFIRPSVQLLFPPGRIPMPCH